MDKKMSQPPIQHLLREACKELRTRPLALADFIPLLQKAADRIDGLQAQIDELMLEYCPDDMTPDQMAEWERHQVLVKSSKPEHKLK
jgi:hypothetical protein